MNLPSLAILIPIYKEKERLLKQNYEVFSRLKYSGKLQVYWLLHESDKETIEIVKRINDKFKVIIDDLNPPLKANALNNALKHLKEEIVAVFDVDNVFSLDYIEKGVRLLLRFSDRNVVLTQGPRSFYNADVNWLTRWQQLGVGWDEYHHKSKCCGLDKPHWWYMFGYAKDGSMDECNIGPWFGVSGTGYFVPKKVLEEVGGWSQSLTEDMDLSIKLYAKGKRMLVFSYPWQYEEAPETIINYLRQQARWRKGWVKDAMNYNVKVNFPNIWHFFRELRWWYVTYSLVFLSFVLGVTSLPTIIRLPLWTALFLGGTVLCGFLSVLLLVVILPYLIETQYRPNFSKIYGFLNMAQWILWGALTLKGWLEIKIGFKPLGWYRTKKRGIFNLMEFLRRLIGK